MNNRTKCSLCRRWMCTTPTLKTPLARARAPYAGCCVLCLPDVFCRLIAVNRLCHRPPPALPEELAQETPCGKP